MTWISGALAVCATLLPATGSSNQPQPGVPGPVVVELFTSQGCYSCPPADELLGELALLEDVLPLAFHVTYWDRLGWPDTLGLEEGTARQYAYASHLGSGRVYTPQMVVHGRIDVVGSQRSRVLQALDIIRGARPEGPRIRVLDGRLSVGAGEAERAVVWLAAYDLLHDVEIDRGENAGKTLRYHNAVRELTKLASFDGQPLTLDLPLARLSDEGRDAAAVLLQRESDGAILSAARIEFP